MVSRKAIAAFGFAGLIALSSIGPASARVRGPVGFAAGAAAGALIGAAAANAYGPAYYDGPGYYGYVGGPPYPYGYGPYENPNTAGAACADFDCYYKYNRLHQY
jgi:hypothetical protein